jgi:hypothetical protein
MYSIDYFTPTGPNNTQDFVVPGEYIAIVTIFAPSGAPLFQFKSDRTEPLAVC